MIVFQCIVGLIAVICFATIMIEVVFENKIPKWYKKFTQVTLIIMLASMLMFFTFMIANCLIDGYSRF